MHLYGKIDRTKGPTGMEKKRMSTEYDRGARKGVGKYCMELNLCR